MNDWRLSEEQVSAMYASFWRYLDLFVHRHGSIPTGALLMVVTIILLERVDYHPTITELAEITRLPKSTLSRYVSVQLNNGFIEEVIDPEDRRRRLLRVTDKAKQEMEWNEDQFREITVKGTKMFRDHQFSENGASDLKKLLVDDELD